MSKGNSPTHRFSGSYDSFYDPNFTAEISNRMQVPERIRVTSENTADLNPRRNKMEIEQGKMFMHVPDRILLTGGDNHMGEDDTLPELRLESAVLGQPMPGIQLVTPPHVITLDNHNFPTIEEDNSHHRNKLEKAPVSSAVQVHNGYPVAPSTPPSLQSEDDVVTLRRQMRTLSRRVLVIEQENQQRQQREIVLYSVGIVYFVLKGLMWLHRHW